MRTIYIFFLLQYVSLTFVLKLFHNYLKTGIFQFFANHLKPMWTLIYYNFEVDDLNVG